MEKCKTKLPMFLWEKSRLLFLLSLFLFSGYIVKGQDCNSPRQVFVGTTIDGSTAGNASNYDDYFFSSGPRGISGTEGPEAIHFIDWVEGEIEITLSDFSEDADIILLRECNNTSLVAGSPNTGTSRVIKNCLLPGRYYIFVDSRESTGSSYKLSIKQNVPQLPDYHITGIDAPVSAGLGTSIQVKATIRNNGYTVATDAELAEAQDVVYLNFNDGGDFRDQILKEIPTRKIEGGQEIQIEESIAIPADVPLGNNYSLTYFTDGNRKITELSCYTNIARQPINIVAAPVPDCDNPIELTVNQTYNGNTDNGANNFDLYNNDSYFSSTGLEVMHKFDWPGGQAKITLSRAFSGVYNLILLKECDPGTNSYIQGEVAPENNPITKSLAPGTYYIAVDGKTPLSYGDYDLLVEPFCEPTAARRAHDDSANEMCETEITQGEMAYMLRFQEEIQRFEITPEMLNRATTRFPVTAHIINRSNGQGGIELSTVEAAIANANGLFQGANIAFFICGVNYINDDLYFDISSEERNSDFLENNEHYVANTINIYFPNTYNGKTDNGSSNFPLDENEQRKPDWMIIPSESATNNVFVHEMGHYFNLLHTHDKTNGAELVDGTNCATAGDLICDTPADPGLRLGALVDEQCGYLTDNYYRDPNCQPYAPLTDNIMSYTRPDCMASFTPQQYARMAHAAQNLRSYLTCANPQLPDYITLSFKINDQTSLEVTAGEQVSISFAVRNQGVGASLIGTKAKYYYSADMNLDASDQLLGSNDIEALNPGQHTARIIPNVTIPQNAQAGTRYILCKADADNELEESDEDNNIAKVTITVLNSQKPDYRPTSLTGPNTANAGQGIEMQVTLKNDGPVDGNGNGGKDKYYISSTSNLNASNLVANATFLKAYDTDNIAAGETKQYPGGFTIPSSLAPGTYYIYFFHDADNKIDESNEDNNVIWRRMTIEANSPKPDYQPTDFRARGGATTLQAGGTLVIDLKIKNNGPVDGQGNGGKDKYYFNTTPDLNGSPIFLRDFGTADINANSHYDVNSGPLDIPAATAPGTYYIVFFHDADNKIDESNEDNNVAFLQITVTAPGSGLTANFSASETDICAGENVQFTSTVLGGSNVIVDQSGNGKDGELINFGANPYQDNAVYGKALTFDGTDDHVELPENLTAGLNQFTFEVRCFLETNDSGQRIFDFGTGTSKFMFLTPYQGSEKKPEFWIVPNGIGSRKILKSADVLQPGQWYHFAVVLDGSKGKLYINGELKDDEDIAFTPADLGNLNRNWLGRSQFGSDKYLKGKLDEVRIWDFAKTQQQIQNQKDRELNENEKTNLVAYYKFNQEVSGVSYNWSVQKDGSIVFTSTEANPSFTFADEGTYRVSLTVTSNGQTDSEVKEGYITVEDCSNGLTVDFTADNTDPCVGESVQFSSIVSRSDPNQAYDRSGNGNHGTLNGFQGQPYVENAGFGKALNFAGAGNDVSLGDLGAVSDWTIETWFKPSITNSNENLFHSENVVNNIGIRVETLASGQTYVVLSGGGAVLVKTFATLSNQWYHLAISADKTNNKLYIYLDGQEVVDQAHSSWPTSFPNFVIGTGLGSGAIRNFSGNMDEFRIWNDIRTQAEIQANKDKELTGNEAGLLAYYDFNQTVNPENLTYLWSFNGPNTFVSDEANPTITFTAATTYTVSLSVSDGNNNYVETKTDYITVQGCEPDWEVTKTGDNHIVLLDTDDFDVTLENGQTLANGDYLGAFYNDNGTFKCAGKLKWMGENSGIVIYGDDPTTSGVKDGFSNGEVFQWKLWQSATGQEIDVSATYEIPANVITHKGQFAANGVSKIITITEGSLAETQTITIQPGWNLISSYIQPSDADMANVFESLSEQLSIVKDEVGTAYIPSSAINNIGNWEVVEGYQVRVTGSTPIDLEIRGIKVDAALTSIPLSRGWNLIPYLRESEQDIAVALNPVNSEVHIVKNIDGQIYMPALGINNIENMKPGQAYWTKMNTNTSLDYTARMATPPSNMHTAQLIPNRYSIDRSGIHNATMILDTKGLVAFGDEVGVFDAKGKLVGAAIYEDHVLAFSIWGDDPTTDAIDGLEEGDEFEIRVWNKATGTEGVFAFNANVDLYTTNGIIQAELLRTTSVPSLLEANSLKLYPNPTRNNATLSIDLKTQVNVQATIFDLSGKRLVDVAQEQMTDGSHELKISTAQLPSGLYHCRILVDGVIHNIPFSVVK